MAVPTLNAALAAWSINFNTRGVAAPEDVDLTAPQMAQYTSVHTPFISAFNACNAEGAKSHALVLARNSAKAALLPYARFLYGTIKANPNVSDETKALFGVHVNDVHPTPIPPPAMKAAILLQGVDGHSVDARIVDPAVPTRRAWPDGVRGATIFSHVGETVPASLTDWVFQASVTRPEVRIDFPSSVAPGSKVFLLAFFVNNRLQSGPASDAVSTYIQFGGAAEQA
jgi:hypothetical protein